MKTKILKVPGVARFAVSADTSPNGIGESFGSFLTNLSAQVIRNGEPVQAKELLSRKDRFLSKIKGDATELQLGSGLVTNVGVLAMANDFNWATGFNTLKLANQHMTGTGTTTAAATDVKLQTISTSGGQTAVAGTQTLVSAGNLQKYQTVATITYAGTEAVTEWGLHTSSVASSTTGSPATATSATSLTATGTPFTASTSTVRGDQQYIVLAGTAQVWGLITSNTTSVLSVPAWYKVSDGTAGSTPTATDTFTVYPVLWDHKTFAAINVVSGDSIAFTYTLTLTSGG